MTAAGGVLDMSQGNRFALGKFLASEEEGTQAIEHLLLFLFAVVPCFVAILMIQDVLREYIELTVVVVTSPFF